MGVVRIPLASPIQSRATDLSKDSRSLNGYFETVAQGERDFVKRPGYTNVTLTGTPLGSLPARGIFTLNGNMYAAYGANLYQISPSLISTLTNISMQPGNTVSMTQTLGATYLFLQDHTYGYTSPDGVNWTKVDNTGVYDVEILAGGTGYVSPTVSFSPPPAGGTTATGTVQYTGGAITGVTITNPGTGYISAPSVTFSDASGTGASAQSALNGFPYGPLANGVVFMDSYVIVATTAGKIYQSNTNNPTLWDPLQYTAAIAEPDTITAITKHFNYLVTFSTWHTEFFYDTGIIPTGDGSTFQRQDSARAEIGCVDGNSVCQFEQGVIWVGTSKTHGKGVYVLDGLVPVRVSTRYIERFLNTDYGKGLNDILSYVFKIHGHTFYVMTMFSLNISSSLPQNSYNGVTFVYDLEEKEWYVWTTYGPGGGDQNFWQPTFFAEFNNTWYAQLNSSSQIVKIDSATPSDNGSAIWFETVTPLMDFGNTKNKFFNKLEVVGDKTSVASGSTMSIAHTGDDYNTWSTYRVVTLSNPRSMITQLGRDRRRAWDLVSVDNVPQRLRYIELDITGGEDVSTK